MSLKSITEIQSKYLRYPMCLKKSQFAVQVGVQYNLRDYPLTCKDCGHQAFIEFWKATTEEDLVPPTYYGAVDDTVVNRIVRTEADIQAGLEEQKIRDKLIELGWTPPQGPKDLDFTSTKQAEPVAYTNKEQLGYLKDPKYSAHPMAMWASKSPSSGIALYTHPAPAVAVNEQLLESTQKLLSWIDDCCETGDSPEIIKIAEQAEAAIAAAEELKAQQESKG